MHTQWVAMALEAETDMRGIVYVDLDMDSAQMKATNTTDGQYIIKDSSWYRCEQSTYIKHVKTSTCMYILGLSNNENN